MTAAAIDYLNSLDAVELSRLGDTFSDPSSGDSAGAKFVMSIRDDVIRAWDKFIDNPEDNIDYYGAATYIANRRSDVDPLTTWKIFLEFQCWNEDRAGYGYEPTNDLTIAAQQCLYMIGDRLVYALVELGRLEEE